MSADTAALDGTTRAGDAPDRTAVAAALETIRQALGPKGWVDDPAALEPWLVDSRGVYRGSCLGMAKPASTEEVAAVMRAAYAAGIPVVPQGGNTGRVAGATPDDTGRMLIVNLARMNRVNVLRYGNARDLCLGLEAVLPDGRVWHGLTGLRKNNTGYDLKHLFMGSEGTLGIITAAVLKLFPKPKARATALVALGQLDDALTLLADAKAASGGTLTSFELMPGLALDWAERLVDGARRPFEETHDWTVLLEFAGEETVEEGLQGLLERAFEDGRIVDAVIAQSEDQRAQLWFLREAIVDAQNREGAQIKHDVSVPVSAVPTFIREAAEAVEKVLPGTRPYPFGHVGDGNIHYNLSQPEAMEGDAFRARADDLHRAVHDVVARLDGSISAEHGIGRAKRGELARYKDPLEIDIMRQVKRALDPKGLMNPGALLPDAE
jgi:D-lactate dehydrogenase (cytochrome)